MRGDSFEVAVVGAGPAGATAAIRLAQKGHSVVLIDRRTFPTAAPITGWVNVRVLPLLGEMSVSDKPLRRSTLRSITFYNADFTKTAKPAFDEAPGYLIDRTEFAHILVKAAVRQGVTLVEGCALTEVQLKEPGAVLSLADGRELHGRLLLLAPGWRSPLLDRTGLESAPAEVGFWTAQVEAPVKGAGSRSRPTVGVVLGLDRAESSALLCVWKDRVSISLNWAGKRGQAASILQSVCRLGFDEKVIPVDLTPQVADAPIGFSPAGAALDMDSHVAKHTLVIGDAGGFISAASNEGIYPAMWSARIAADVADAALASVHSQDELMTFDTAWRVEMADYLRSPQTDTQFLLPLIFSNQPMADRMGAAFFSGENI